MNYFLRNLPSPIDQFRDAACDDEEHTHFSAVRQEYAGLLLRGSERRFGSAALLRWKSGNGGRKEQQWEGGNRREELFRRAKGDVENGNERQPEEKWERHSPPTKTDVAFACLDLAACPSSIGADALAQTIVYRLIGVLQGEGSGAKALWPEEWAQQKRHENPLCSPLFSSAGTDYCAAHSSLGVPSELVGISLDSVFSVLLELNRREPDLCAQSLQSLLQLLQHLEPESLSAQPRAMIARMHELLRELRREGNAQVSTAANACMMGLAVASGHPDFLFATIGALLCEPKRHLPHNQLSADSSPLSRNLQSLVLASQRHILDCPLTPNSPAWLKDPLEQRPLVCEFDVIYPGSAMMDQSTKKTAEGVQGCIVSDGAFVYLLTVHGLLKMGTGLSETRAGEVLVCNDLLKFIEGSALFVSNELYLRRRHSSRLWVLDTISLREIGEIILPSALTTQGVLFADGNQFWHATLDEQWNLVCTALNDSFAPAQEQSPNGGAPAIAQQHRPREQGPQTRLMECEFCAFGEQDEAHESMLRSIPAKLRGTTADLQLGPGVGFLMSRCGQVYYAGPESEAAFGLVPSADPLSWTRLSLSEPIVTMALESANKTLVLRSGSGNLWLVSARTKGMTRGKQAKRLKMPNKRKCVSASLVSVGGGCLAFAMENGRTFMLGRHVLSNAPHTGMQPPALHPSPFHSAPMPVPGMEQIQVAQLALGKTHLVAIGKNGALYATGLNNQNQCGRGTDAQQPEQQKKPTAAVPAIPLSSLSSSLSSASSSSSPFCLPSQHLFLEDLAALCVRCGQCSVRGAACPLAASQPKGSFCACAQTGPSCCLRCGVCKECAGQGNRDEGFGQQRRAASKMLSPRAVRMMRQTETTTAAAPLARDEVAEEERARDSTAGRAPIAQKAHPGATTTSIFPPERVVLQQQPNIKVATVSVGNFHSVVLSADNQVYTFGANTHGQLGTGDTLPRAYAHRLALSANVQVVQAVAGANHTVLRTLDGRLVTFGAHKAGQLGRKRLATPADKSPATRQWFAEPGFVPGFGQAYGRLASWVGAQGDRTLVQVQRQLISRSELANGRVSANAECLLVQPGANSQGRPLSTASKGYLLVRRTRQQQFRHRQWSAQPSTLAKCSFCLDPRHSNLLWAYDPARMCVFALSDAPISVPSPSVERDFLRLHRQQVLRSTELMVPSMEEPDAAANGGSANDEAVSVRFSDVQLALLLLSTVHSLCLAALAGRQVSGESQSAGQEGDADEAEQTSEGGTLLRESEAMRADDRDCLVVNRFENFGGGWGYSAHCVEAIQFRTDRDILLCAVGLFGGRGEYTARLKLFRTLDGEEAAAGGQQCVELLAETDEVLYECAPRETAVLQLERPIRVARERWHVVWVQILGPSSDCGAGGQAVVRVEGGGAEEENQAAVEFQFRDNPLSNNGTNVEVGQIPELYFLAASHGEDEGEEQTDVRRRSRSAAKHRRRGTVSRLISAQSLFDVYPAAIGQLHRIAEWALHGGAFLPVEFGASELLMDCDALWRQERAALVAVLSLRLMRLFLCAGQSKETAAGSGEAIVAFHRLLRTVLSQRHATDGQDAVGVFVLAEAALSYRLCAHLFIPSAAVLGTRLSDQLANGERGWWLFALLSAAHRTDKHLLPLLGFGEEQRGQRDRKQQREAAEALWREEEQKTRGEQTTGQNSSQCEDGCSSPLAIVRFLFELAFAETADGEGDQEREESGMHEQGRPANRNPLLRLLCSTAQHLVACLAHRLVLRCLPTPVSCSLAPVPLQSPSRFRHISAHPQWEVGENGSWDSIALRVDADGILLAGAGVFSGTGSAQGPQSLEMEFLQNDAVSGASEDWRLLERVHVPLDQFPTQMVLLCRAVPLRAGQCYALRVHFCGGGKTLYGEGGLFSVRLRDHQTNVHFLPCGMSTNGTTVSRGQFPFLLYQLAGPPHSEQQGNRQMGSKEGEREAAGREECALFVHLLRQMAVRLSRRMVHCGDSDWGRALLRRGEQRLCATLVGLANTLVEGRPPLAFDLVAVLDEALMTLAHVNAAEQRPSSRVDPAGDSSPSLGSSSSSGDSMSNRETMPACASAAHRPWRAPSPISLECPHPYRPGQLVAHRIHFPPSATALSLRFDPLSRTTRLQDALWVYAEQGDTLFPVARLAEREWPRGELTVPGHSLLLVLESGGGAEGEQENAFGFRCSVEPIAAPPKGSANASLESQLVWSLGNACRVLAQLEPGTAARERELLAAGAGTALLRKGLRLSATAEGIVPSLGELLSGELAPEERPKELDFLFEFSRSPPHSSPLALALCAGQPFVHLGHCQLHFAHPLRIGKYTEVKFLVRDQHAREVVPAGEFEVCVVLSSGAMGFEQTPKRFTRLQKSPFRPVSVGRALYHCISMAPQFGQWSFEELRFAFAFNRSLKERIWLTSAEGGAVYSASWTPRRAGVHTVQCTVDGVPLPGGPSSVEVHESGGEDMAQQHNPSYSPIGSPQHSLSLRVLRAHNPPDLLANAIAAPLCSPSVRFPAVNAYLALRVRVHPSLSAPQIGDIPRGSTLQFAEVQRNADGIWLRLAEESRRELLLARESATTALIRDAEAWVLQLNAHLQTEYLQMTPPSNGNFLPDSSPAKTVADACTPPAAGPPSQSQPLTISILDSPKFRKRMPLLSPTATSPDRTAALGPAMFEAFRWVFAALVWHSPDDPSAGETCSLEELIQAAQHLDRGEDANRDDVTLQRAQRLWRAMSEGLWRTSSGGQSAPEEAGEERGDSRAKHKDAVLCELCGGRFPRPVAVHMRQRHPGCGGTVVSWGYNSAGQWTTGWSGRCGEGGQGNAVWYLLCARCRETHLRRRGAAPSKLQSEIGVAQALKRNAQFLLSLNRAKRRKPRQQRDTVVVDLYPHAGRRRQRDEENGEEKKWHSSDPGQHLPAAPFSPPSPTSRPSSRLYSQSASAHLPTEAEGRSTGCRPTSLLGMVLAFCCSPHDLAAIRDVLSCSLLRAVAFGFAFRLWTWLIKMASAEQSVLDTVWHLLSTLRPLSQSPPLLPHPAQLCLLAGSQPTAQMIVEFHSLLHSLATVLQSPAEGMDPRLKCLCFRAWTFQLTGHEQALLPAIRSLLSTVGNVLSASSDTVTAISTESANKSFSAAQPPIHQQLEDLSEMAQLKGSSRAQLLPCLLDGSCDTFWESGEEDRARERRLGVEWATGEAEVQLLGIFIDNSKDEGFRVNRLEVCSGAGTAEERVVLDTRLDKLFSGWIKCGVGGHTRVDICIWGDDLGCRVRQLRLLGQQRCDGAFSGAREERDHDRTPTAATATHQQPCCSSSLRPSNSQQLLFSGAQCDAFALFQSLAIQMFGDEFAAEGNGTLREQVLDLLFSRSQLQPLQSFVCAHMSNAVEREVANLRARRKRNFSYASAILQMLVRMCSSCAGVAPPSFAPDGRLLLALSELWLFAPPVVQMQAISAFERLLPHTRPECVDLAQLAEHLLLPVVKALRLQVKQRRQSTKHTVGSHALDVPTHWTVDRYASVQSAQEAIRLLRSLAPTWRDSLRLEVGQLVMRLCAVVRDSLAKGRALADCIRCAHFWMGVAALSAMDGHDWLERAPAYQQAKNDQLRAKDPLCENHDDGRTRAQLRCQTCALSLCRECFSILHLNRRNQGHRARLVGSQSAAVPRLDFHEGCTRLRVGTQLLLVLVNPHNLAGLVELGDVAEQALRTTYSSLPSSSSSLCSVRKYSQETARMAPSRATMAEDNEEGVPMDERREEEEEDELLRQKEREREGTAGEEAKCRFCAARLAPEQQVQFDGICEFEECRQKAADACQNMLPCGHWCGGIRTEQQCPPCLHCTSSSNLCQDADDLCAICFSERLGECACVLLNCGHLFHWRCVRTALEKRWPGPRIAFRFAQCPLCKTQIEHVAFADLLGPLRELQTDVERKAMLRLEYERGLAGTSAKEGEKGESSPLETALAKYVYVQCSRCQKAYFGGESRCQQELEEADLVAEFDPAELVCGSCAAEMAGGGGQVCGRHGTDFLEFKCRFCCSVAMYFCFGTTHFCAACHADFQRLVLVPRHSLPKCPVAPRAVQLPETEPCPLRVAHPPTGEEFALGCGICRNLRTF